MVRRIAHLAARALGLRAPESREDLGEWVTLHMGYRGISSTVFYAEDS